MTNKTVNELVERLLKHCALRANSVPAREAMEQAATTLTQQAAEIEALREALKDVGVLLWRARENGASNDDTERAERTIGTALTGGGPTDEA